MIKHRILQTIYIFIIAVLLGLIYILLTNRYVLFDAYRLAVYNPSPQIEQLALDAGFSEKGRNLFYVSDPQILPEKIFDAYCDFGDLGLVLGCYDGQTIFMLDVQEERLEPVETVTAAHEMLHVVYSRLNANEKDSLIELLTQQYDKTDNERIKKEIEAYKKDPEADIYNELHSIFGSEYEDLIPELQAHYDRYFSNRDKVLKKSAQYEKVFTSIQNKIKDYDVRLKSISREINLAETRALILQQQITGDRETLNILLAQNEVQQYNAMVPAFNAKVTQYNALVEDIKDLITDYNQIVIKRNALVYEENDLKKSLDSDLETI